MELRQHGGIVPSVGDDLLGKPLVSLQESAYIRLCPVGGFRPGRSIVADLKVHGHNYVVELVLRSVELNGDGFVRDYNELAPFENFIDEKLDHRHLDDVIDGPSTAENLARFLYKFAKGMWPEVAAVRVSETPKTWAEYRPGP